MKSKVTERGQVTIPKRLRDRLGIRPGQVLDFVEEDGTLIVRRRSDAHPVDAAYGVLESDATTDELMAIVRGDPLEGADGA